MQKKDSDKTFSYYINEIGNLAEFLKSYPDGNVADSATLIDRNVKELKKALTGIRLTLLFLATVTIASVMLCIFSLSSAKFRGYFVNDNLALKDSLLNVSEKNQQITYRTKNDGTIITYSDLLKKNDSLELKLISVESSLRLAKSDLDLCKLKLDFAEKDLSYYKGNSKFYEDINNKRETEDFENLKKNINNLQKVDSGRVLLDVFRKNMKYDPKSKSWTIDLNKK